ncbi:DUF5681 domain-containing protein [Sphingomonas montanisoli]|uniref:DUF5681 domain-containing protein n=1 Tax=Sphingomonas montanisoli TaxID=2606412 RepID=A0A5D9C477_9SPHN|nr:DUF5681 domain-containing protein [Sphingomonas montanisoli]TZG25800.1 hypothetical protein FYJ91_12455 [Sphingomonas montanisoli]
MAIIRKSELDARRARAAAEQSALEAMSSSTSVTPSQQATGLPVRPKKARRPKKQPTGDYEVGYCRAPEETKFQKGCKPGPGRGKGNMSQASILREVLSETREVSVGGEVIKVQNRKALELVRLGKAFSGDWRQLLSLLEVAFRLFPDRAGDNSDQNGDDEPLTQTGMAILDMFAQDTLRNAQKSGGSPGRADQ